MRKMVQEVWRTEVMETKPHSALQRVCQQSKNLYNRAMFIFKQHYRETKNHLSYQQLDRRLKTEDCYKLLPAHTAQHTLKLLTRNWKSFANAVKEFQINPKAFLGPPRPPRYKRKSGQQIAIFSNQQVRIRKGKLLFPKKVPFTIKTRLSDTIRVKEVRIIPRWRGYTIEIVYTKIIPTIKEESKRRGAIDLGVKNLITYVDNLGSRPIIVKDEGKGIKSIINYYLKETKKIQVQCVQQQQSTLEKNSSLNYGSRYHHLRETKRRKVREWLHQMSKAFVDYWVEQGIEEVTIGYNPLWKQQVRLRKKTTQMFVIIPFDKIIRMLKYKAAEHGILVERTEEGYTSKCSFLDNEFPQKREIYKGRRIKRGMFKSAKGHLINSDVNGAYNIMLKRDPQALPPRSVGGVGGYVIYPLRWSFEQ
jgi:putative transposase